MEGIFQTRDYKHFKVINNVGETLWEGVDSHRMLPGDIVQITNNHNENQLELVRRNERKGIVGILQTSSQVRQGLDKRGHIIYLFRPIDISLPEFAVASNLNRQLTNQWCVIDYLDWPTTSKRPRGSIQQYLGFVNNYDVELEALYKHYRGKSIEHKSYKVAYAKQMADIIKTYNQPETWQLDRQLVDDYIVSIDPPGCLDIDDALSLVALNGGDFRLSIHIADVQFWIKENSPMDIIAKEMGATLYGIGKNFPIYPRELCEGVFSLIPDGVGRSAISLNIIINAKKGEILEQSFANTVIKNARALNYENYKEDPNIDWECLFQLTDILAGKLGLPGTNGDSHRLIEILMIYYSTTVARQSNCNLFRTQEKNVMVDEENASLPDELKFLALESAQYVGANMNNNKGHYCLGLDKYTHATSPIRRYADLLVQRGLAVVDETVRHLNCIQKHIKKFHRDVQFIKAIYENEHRQVSGIVLDGDYVYVLNWKQRVRFENSLTKYSTIELRYYIDPNPIQWKKKIIFQLC